MLKTVRFSFIRFRNLINLESSRNYVRRGREPGVNKRLKMFSDDFIESDPETAESLEPDFFNVGQAHKAFQADEKKFKQNVATRIVGHKYFNEKQINFLTWTEKEQIRMLSQKEEWTVDKLSESFPADPMTITKIIRNNWQPKNEQRVQKHDESVKKSWSKFKAGELKLDPMLEQHLKKFVHRDLDLIAKKDEGRKFGTEIPKPRSREFSRIITSCKKYAKELKTVECKIVQIEGNEFSSPKSQKGNPDTDFFILEGNSKKKTMKSMTLTAYEKLSPEISVAIEEHRNATKAPRTIDETFPDNRIDKFEKTVSTIENSNSQVFKSLEIKDQIDIPKKLWKKDQIYKVGDCFYSDDGEFLYRVPGLS